MRDAEAVPALVVARCTPQHVRAFGPAADVALNGADANAPCSLTNVCDSCFAIERCGRGELGAPLQLADIACSEHSFIAYTPRAHGSSARSGEAHFVGCVSARDAREFGDDFPNAAFAPGSLMVSNLCVALPYRRHGAGSMLLDAVCDSACGADVYIAVVDGSAADDAALRARLKTRSDGLLAAYRNRGFARVCSAGDLTLLARPGSQGGR